ncbi:MAG: hypothetical protein U1G05_06565 [Kiritimatiellia bacterium]
MIAAPHARLSTLLQSCGLFTPERVQELMALQKSSGSPLTRVVVDNQSATEEAYLRALAGRWTCRPARWATPSNPTCSPRCRPARSTSTA